MQIWESRGVGKAPQHIGNHTVPKGDKHDLQWCLETAKAKGHAAGYKVAVIFAAKQPVIQLFSDRAAMWAYAERNCLIINFCHIEKD